MRRVPLELHPSLAPSQASSPAADSDHPLSEEPDSPKATAKEMVALSLGSPSTVNLSQTAHERTAITTTKSAASAHTCSVARVATRRHSTTNFPPSTPAGP